MYGNKDKFLNDYNYNIYLEKNICPFLDCFRKIIEIAEKNSSSFNFDEKQFVDRLFDCEAKLPYDSYFTDFSDIFSQLLSNISLISLQGDLCENWVLLRRSILETWKTFIFGANAKNEMMAQDCKFSDFQYQKKIIELNSLIRQTDSLIEIDSNYVPNYTESQAKIVNSAIRSYLGDDIEDDN